MSQAATAAPRVADAAPKRSRARTRVLRPLLMLGGIAVVAVGAGYFWLTGGRYVSIDDAYVRAAKESPATDVSGIVAQVPVHEGEPVAAGQVMLQLDDRQFVIALDRARANLAQVALTMEAMKQDYRRMLHDADAKVAQLDADQANYERFANLVKSGSVTRAEYDNSRFAVAADRQAVEALRVQAKVQLAKLGGNADIDVRDTPQYREAKAQVDEAQRQLDHTVIRAPFDGTVTQVDSVQPGMYLAAATPAFGIVSTADVWVEANPKETELTHVKPGDSVAISVDTYPGRTWPGTVQSISPNSGSEFSILPAQNTSGNWVKVVQRIPVRIAVERRPDDPPLRAGMSVEATIDTGHRRSISDLF
ncbi:MAG: HlyD family secretion protein [Proteobacteria bacterium]|nr:HlyD family secretion protein [Pseudomonadota bacterium]